MNVPDGMRDREYKKRYRHAVVEGASRPEWMYLILLSMLMQQTSASGHDRVFSQVLDQLHAFYPDKTLPQLIAESDKVLQLLNSVHR
jgi:hypothetical protein